MAPAGGYVVDEIPLIRAINYNFVNASASGNTQVVPAQGAGIRIRIVAGFVMAAVAVSVNFADGSGAISGTMALAANGGFVLPRNDHGWFETGANSALNINLGGVANVGVTVVWIQAT
jgi:hypothetical protein